jgi:hypothetical protein
MTNATKTASLFKFSGPHFIVYFVYVVLNWFARRTSVKVSSDKKVTYTFKTSLLSVVVPVLFVLTGLVAALAYLF